MESLFGILGILAIAGIIIYRYKTDPNYLNKVSNSFGSTKSPSVPSESGAAVAKSGFVLIGGLIGGIIGGFIGFSLRPAAPLIGQLPLETVITGGGNLRGIDSLLISTAQTSFNYLLFGTILGGVAGIITVLIAFNKNRQVSVAGITESNSLIESSPVIPKQVELNQLPEEVINVLGQPQKIINLGAKVIYDYGDMKIIFVDGKVSDVQY